MATSHAEIIAALLGVRQRYGAIPPGHTWDRLGLRPWSETIRRFYAAPTFAEAVAIALAAYPQEASL